MGQRAPRVHVEPEVIARIESWIKKLPGHVRVEVTCEDGRTERGIVCIQPTVQSFRDRKGHEGLNGVLRLEDADAPGGEHHIWLDQIVNVRRLMSYVSNRAA